MHARGKLRSIFHAYANTNLGDDAGQGTTVDKLHVIHRTRVRVQMTLLSELAFGRFAAFAQ